MPVGSNPYESDSLGKERMKGVIFGHAVGDALGVGAKFLTKAEIAHHYPDGLKTYDDMVLMDHTRRWRRGNWTDVSSQMLCVLETLYFQGRIDPVSLANLLADRHGGDGTITLGPVISHRTFRTDPFRAAKEVFETGNPNATNNGAIMRTSIVGIWHPDNLDVVRANAEAACLVTHYDKRCVDSCIAVSCAIATLVNGGTVEGAIKAADEQTAGVFAEFFSRGIDASVSSYQLDESDRMRDPLKAMKAGFHVLKHAASFHEGLCRVIHEGGDATTNGAVAGALLGARFGFARIPAELVKGLNEAAELEARIQGGETRKRESANEAGKSELSGLAAGLQQTPLAFALGALVSVYSACAWVLRAFSRFVVSVVSGCTGWMTEDVYYVSNGEKKEEVIGSLSGQGQDAFILIVVLLVAVILVMAKLWSFQPQTLPSLEVPVIADLKKVADSKPEGGGNQVSKPEELTRDPVQSPEKVPAPSSRPLASPLPNRSPASDDVLALERRKATAVQEYRALQDLLGKTRDPAVIERGRVLARALKQFIQNAFDLDVDQIPSKVPESLKNDDGRKK